MTAAKEFSNRAAPALAVVDGEVVHIHGDEPIGLLGVEPSSKLLRVLEGLRPVFEAVEDAGVQVPRDGANQVLPKVPPNHVAAEREGKTGQVMPLDTEVEPKMKAPVSVRELAFMDEESGLRLAARDGVFDRIEWEYDGFELRLAQLQR